MAVDLTGSYQEVVKLYGDAAAGYAHSGDPTVPDRLHAAEGIQEEAIELVEVVARIYDRGGNLAAFDGLRRELLAEMGGVVWYVNYAAHVYGHTLADVLHAFDGHSQPAAPEPNTFRDTTLPLLWNARKVASTIKKHAYHGKPMESTTDLLQYLYLTWVRVAVIGGSYGVLVREAMAFNLAELEQRHGGASFNPAVYTEGRK